VSYYAAKAVSILGNRTLWKEDPNFLMTGGVCAEDLESEESDGALRHLDVPVSNKGVWRAIQQSYGNRA
jgi:hypothetical protein